MITRYEMEFGAWLGAERAFAFASGRAGLYFVLKALGISDGDEVIVPAFTCRTVPEQVLLTGARSVFVDIDPLTLNVSLVDLLRGITPRTKSVIFQSTFGMVDGRENVVDACKARGIPVIVDSAHACPAGSAPKAGEGVCASVYSTGWAKVITTGMGGVVASPDAAIAHYLDREQERCKSMPAISALTIGLQAYLFNRFYRPALLWPAVKVHTWLVDHGLSPPTTTNTRPASRHIPSEYNFRMSGLQTCVGRHALAGLSTNLQRRQELLMLAHELLETTPFRVHGAYAAGRDAYLFLPISVPNKCAILKRAQAAGVALSEWPPQALSPLAPAKSIGLGYVAGSCPVAENSEKTIICIPIHPRFTDGDMRAVAEFLNDAG